MRKAVREQLRRGADYVKLMATGARSVLVEDPEPAQMTRPELAAIVDEAHRLGVRVAAHVEGLEGARLAVGEGVDTIEHGLSLHREPALLEAMATRGIVLVPDAQHLPRPRRAIHRRLPPGAGRAGQAPARGGLRDAGGRPGRGGHARDGARQRAAGRQRDRARADGRRRVVGARGCLRRHVRVGDGARPVLRARHGHCRSGGGPARRRRRPARGRPRAVRPGADLDGRAGREGRGEPRLGVEPGRCERARPPLPEFALPSVAGAAVALSDLHATGPALLLFVSEECPTCALTLRRLAPVVPS